MASTYYFQIKTEQALAALETAMDLDRLQVYHVSSDFLHFFKKGPAMFCLDLIFSNQD